MSTDAPGGAEVQSLAKGLAVIRIFGAERPRLTLTEVANLTGLSRAGARRVLHTLRSLGYVSSNGRYFQLEPKTLDLGFAYLSSLSWWQTAQTASESLAESTGLPVAVGVREGEFATYVAHARPRRFDNVPRSVGARLPIAISAIGRVLLTSCTEAELNVLLETLQIEKLTPNTVADVSALRTELRKTEERGYAFVDQELEIGLRTLAVPIRSRRDQITAAIGIGSFELDSDAEALVDRYLGPLREAAATIAASMAS